MYLAKELALDVAGEGFEVAEVGLENVEDPLRVDLGVLMDQEISEAGHGNELLGEGLGEDFGLAKDGEDVGVVLRGAQALVGDKVIADVQDTFDREMKIPLGGAVNQRVFQEPRQRVLLQVSEDLKVFAKFSEAAA